MHFFTTENDKDSSEILATIEKNYTKASRLREQIKRLKIEPSTEDVDLIEDDKDEVHSYGNIEVDEDDKEFEDEFDFFLNDYEMLAEDFSKDELLAILPSRKSHYFKNIVIRLQAEAIKDIKEIYEFINVEKENIDKEDLETFKSEINKLERKIKLLKEVLDEKVEEAAVTTEVCNKLVLVPTLSGNIRIIDDIEHISTEFYPSFLELINSIVDGTFKRVKRFNDYLTRTCEVRGYQTRVVFSRLDRNTYALITAFVKKTDNGREYQEYLKNRIGEYRKIEDNLKKKLTSKEFMENNDFYVNELLDILGENDKVKSYGKGDLND